MAQSVLTAGLVMGVMLIPFVSSLDDIITAVPRTLRDGSLGSLVQPAPKPSNVLSFLPLCPELSARF